MSEENAESSRRRQRRNRTYKAGKIVFNEGFSTIDCVIKDLSETGAKIRLENAVLIPATFDLVLSDNRTWNCRVRWRRMTECGVEFL